MFNSSVTYRSGQSNPTLIQVCAFHNQVIFVYLKGQDDLFYNSKIIVIPFPICFYVCLITSVRDHAVNYIISKEDRPNSWSFNYVISKEKRPDSWSWSCLFTVLLAHCILYSGCQLEVSVEQNYSKREEFSATL